MKTRLLLPLLLGLFASCQSMSEGILSLEGRAIVYSDQSIDDVQSIPDAEFDDDDVDVQSYGVQAAVMTPIVDVLGAVDWREFGDETTPELGLGARRRFLEIGRFHPFVEANLRYGVDLDAGTKSDDYFGWNAGLGALVDISDNVFLSARVMWETSGIATSAGTKDVDGLIAMLGAGIAF